MAGPVGAALRLRPSGSRYQTGQPDYHTCLSRTDARTGRGRWKAASWYRGRDLTGFTGRMDAATRTAWLVLIRPARKTDRARTKILSAGDQTQISTNPTHQRPGSENYMPYRPRQRGLFS